MDTAMRRGTPDLVMQAALTYITAKHDESAAKEDKGTKDSGPYATCAAYIRQHGEQDSKGSYTWLFPKPVTIDGATYKGMKLQASHPSAYWDEDTARELIDSCGPEAVAAATTTVVVYDYDYLFLLRHQGKLTSAQIDTALVQPPPEYSLNLLKGR